MNESFKHLKRWLWESDTIADLVAGFAVIAAEIIHTIEHPDAGKTFHDPNASAEVHKLIGDWIAAAGGFGRPTGIPELVSAANVIGVALSQAATKHVSRSAAGGSLKPRRCSHEGCGDRATHIAGLLLRPPRSYGDGEMRVYIDLVLCPRHAEVASVKSLLSDDMWTRLSAGATGVGKVAPDRGRTGSFTEPIDEAPEQFRARYEPAGGEA